MPFSIPMMDAPLERLVRHVVEAMQPLEIWLFGSRAENRARPTSDYDILEGGLEHRLEQLFERFPSDDEWPARLLPFVGYSAYATAYRYPTPGGRIPADPPAEDLRRDISSLRQLIVVARTQLLGAVGAR